MNLEDLIRLGDEMVDAIRGGRYADAAEKAGLLLVEGSKVLRLFTGSGQAVAMSGLDRAGLDTLGQRLHDCEADLTRQPAAAGVGPGTWLALIRAAVELIRLIRQRQGA